MERTKSESRPLRLWLNHRQLLKTIHLRTSTKIINFTSYNLKIINFLLATMLCHRIHVFWKISQKHSLLLLLVILFVCFLWIWYKILLLLFIVYRLLITQKCWLLHCPLILALRVLISSLRPNSCVLWHRGLTVYACGSWTSLLGIEDYNFLFLLEFLSSIMLRNL